MRNTKVINSFNMKHEDFNYRYYETRNGTWRIEKRVKKKFLWLFTRTVWEPMHNGNEDDFGDVSWTAYLFPDEKAVRQFIFDDIAMEERKLKKYNNMNKFEMFYRYIDKNPDGGTVSYWGLPKGY